MFMALRFLGTSLMVHPDTRPVLIVAGPTATGKSALAMAVAEAFDGVVINADSMQVYREMRILTARPDAAAEARVPHRLYGILPVTEACSAARWRDMATTEIAAAHAAGRLPIVCGGTGLYLRALTDGLSPMPDIPEEVRLAVRRRVRRDGAATQHAVLQGVDPAAAAAIPPGDSQRISRALEVFEATGRPLSEWQALPLDGPPQGLRFASVLLLPPRDRLYAACDARLLAMVADGALAEVTALRERGVDPSLPAMKALGVPALLRHLAGEISLDDAVAAAQQATRRFAKRQTTWFQNQKITKNTVTTQFSENIFPEIFSFIRQNLLTDAV
jgi:tRNA dimethylallyltransferase